MMFRNLVGKTEAQSVSSTEVFHVLFSCASKLRLWEMSCTWNMPFKWPGQRHILWVRGAVLIKTVNILATIMGMRNFSEECKDSKLESSTQDRFKIISMYSFFCPLNKHVLSRYYVATTIQVFGIESYKTSA